MKNQWLLQWGTKGNLMTKRDFFLERFFFFSLNAWTSWKRERFVQITILGLRHRLNKTMSMFIFKEKTIVLCCTELSCCKLNISMSLCIAKLCRVNSLPWTFLDENLSTCWAKVPLIIDLWIFTVYFPPSLELICFIKASNTVVSLFMWPFSTALLVQRGSLILFCEMSRCSISPQAILW